MTTLGIITRFYGKTMWRMKQLYLGLEESVRIVYRRNKMNKVKKINPHGSRETLRWIKVL